MFQRVITPSAKKSLKRISRDAQQELLVATEVLVMNPYAGEKLHGSLSFLFSFHWALEKGKLHIVQSRPITTV